METRTVEQVESWQTRSFADGFAGLRELSDGEFSGAVRAGGAWLFMLNGRIIGVFEGSLDDFEDADGTAYAAPHPSLPLLFSMQERGGETQAKYYTNDTPLSEVDSTLTDGKFTGFIELSENVLSGDYYVAYYGGRSMSVAFVGASEQVLTGEEAFERANDEVGIYEVRDVDVQVTDVPEPEEPDQPAGASVTADASSESNESAGEEAGSANASQGSPADATGSSASNAAASEDRGGATGDETGAADGSSAGGTANGAATTDAPAAGTAAADAATENAGSGTADRSSGGSTDRSSGRSGDRSSGRSADRSSGGSADRSSETTPDQPSASARSAPDAGASSGGGEAPGTTAGSAADATAESASGTPESASGATESPADGVESPAATDAPASPNASRGESRSAGAADSADEQPTEDVFDEEAEWRDTTTIPSLDPDRSEGPRTAAGESSDGETAGDDGQSAARPDASSAGSTDAGGRSGAGSQSGRGASSDRQSQSSGRASASGPRGGSSTGSPNASGAAASGSGGGSGEPSDEARERVRKLRTQLEQRTRQVEQLRDRLSTLESERNEYKRERDALTQEVERLEAKLDGPGSSGTGGARRLDPAAAFDGTNLFVRYESKGQATLDEAAAGEASAEDVNANLRLEHHTQFEADEIEVDGEPFEAFLTDSFEYRFVSWVVEQLLYEIRDTGHRTGLADLYESIPKIDRVDLHGSVNAGSDDEDTRQESFDVIMRDRMGNPLVVANLNDSRDPTTGEMMAELVEASTGVSHAHDELAGAFQVTGSFFEPEALEATESATSGGFLSREKRESFVKLSRKRGYHLCLVESRSGGFHLNVPEL